jgi:hypothetical protein
MAKQINTRILLKYDTLANWQASEFNGTDATKYLKAGELAIITLGSDVETDHPENASGQHPLLFKVGDGTHKFDDLAWASALAADVYDWAKAAKAPDEIDTRYAFDIVEGKLQVTETKYIDEVAQPSVVKSYDFVTPTELETALASYYTKTEIDNKLGAIDDRFNNLDDSITTVTEGTGISVTDAGTGNDHAYTVALDVNGAKTALGLGTAAYEDKEAFEVAGAASILQEALCESGDLTVKNAEHADAADEALHAEHADSADYATNAGHADSATHATAAGKVDTALTVKVGGADVVFDGSAAKTADVDAAIAAAIEAEGHPEYSIAKVTTTTGYSATYQLTKDGTAVGTKIDIPKDMVVSKGEVITYENAGAWGNAGTYIVLTLANATNDTLYIPAAGLIEYVTSGSTTDSQVIIAIDENHKVTATIGAGKVTATELAQTVKDDIAKGVEAHGWGDHAEEGYAHKVDDATANNFAALDANGDLIDSGKKAADFQPAGNYVVNASSIDTDIKIAAD